MMFFIAGTIGIAVKNGYEYGFFPWKDQKWFSNPLPLTDVEPPQVMIPWGFHGFDIPDNISIYGYMQTDKYFSHCEDLIRHYFTLKDIGTPYEDCVLVHYRDYSASFMHKLTHSYYSKALKCFPNKRLIVITDNIEKAQSVIGGNHEYISNSPIVDFYLMSKAENIIISNSTFSWWGAWLSKARTVAPRKWMAEGESQTSDDIYCKGWEVI